MDPVWQNIVIGLAIGTAVVYLVVHFVRSRRRKDDPCAECHERMARGSREKRSGSQT